MWKNWLTLSSSDSPEIAFTFVKATRTKREEELLADMSHSNNCIMIFHIANMEKIKRIITI